MASIEQMKAGAELDAARARHVESGQALAATVGSIFRVVLVAVLLALVIRTFVVQPFNIPSRSMAPGLQAGDFILVDKAAYGWSLASLPFELGARMLPGEPALGVELEGVETLARIMGRSPAAGDVIVFSAAGGSGVDYVKRVIARGGDRVSLAGGRVRLNGRELPCVAAGDGLCAEQLPTGARYLVRDANAGPRADFAEILVPAGRYFVLGDNRGDSADSRVAVADGGVGLVRDAQIVGRARLIFFSVGEGRVRFERIGRSAR